MSTPNNIWAMIDNNTNIVVNTIVWDGNQGWECPPGYYLVNITGMTGVETGCLYHAINNSFDCPPH